MTVRLGVWASHPIQYYSPWFRSLATRVDLEVFYGHRQAPTDQAAAGFDVEFEWDVSLLEGYRYRWLNNISPRPSVDHFRGCDNPDVFEILNAQRFDAVLVFGWYLKGALQTMYAARRSDIPVLMRGDSQLQTPRSLLKRIAKFPFYRWLLPRISAHLYVGARNRAYLRHYGVADEKLFFAPHFVDNAFFRDGAGSAGIKGRRHQIRERYEIPEDAFVLLFVGKLVARKRVDDLLQATTIICAASDQGDAHVLIVGDGPLREELERRSRTLPDRIHFLGFQNQTALPAIYAAADVLVLPSSGEETWGLVVNEAMASGLPAIVSDGVGSGPDLIEEGRTGYSYPLGNIDALVRCIRTVRNQHAADPDVFQVPLREKIAGYSKERATDGLERALVSVCG